MLCNFTAYDEIVPLSTTGFTEVQTKNFTFMT
jgi:hypothetical protein